MSERFKVTVKDRKTGESTIYYAHSLGFGFHEKVVAGKTQLLRLVLEHPRKKIKKNK
jgi:hypothetical protein